MMYQLPSSATQLFFDNTFANLLNLPIVVLDLDFNVLAFNQPAQIIHNLTNNLNNKTNYNDWCKKNGFTILFPQCLHDLKLNKFCKQRAIYRTHQNAVIYIEWVISLFCDASNDQRILMIGNNITEKTQLETELFFQKTNETKTLIALIEMAKQVIETIPENMANVVEIAKQIHFYLDSIIEHMPCIVFWKDSNCNYLGCNSYYAKLLGLKSRQAIVGMSDYDLNKSIGYSDVLIDNYRTKDQWVIDNGLPILNDETPFLYNKTIAGAMVLLGNRFPLKSIAGKTIGVLGVAIDVTTRKHTEVINEVVDQKAAQTIKMVSGCIVHEMNTSLSIISIYIDQLRYEITNNSSINDEKQKIKIGKIFTDIKFAIQNSKAITNMLLTKLRNIYTLEIDAKNFKIYSIVDSIKSALMEYPFIKNEKDLVFWDQESCVDFVYLGEKLLTKQVLFNLIQNVLRARKNVDKGEIYISLRCDNNFNYLIFKDTTSGIPKEKLPNIFKQFISASKGNIGLGLAFCKLVMQAYGGDITCSSKEGEFTEFVLSFPVVTQ
jgi:signal transduction histidine kinase